MHTTTAPTATAPTPARSRDTTGDFLLQPPNPAEPRTC